MSIIILPEWAELTHTQIAAKLGCSTTAVLYARRRAAGLCERCSSPAADGSAMCLKHGLATARARRKRTGAKPWKPGRPGRPPAARWNQEP
jgi:hypothetical protein